LENEQILSQFVIFLVKSIILNKLLISHTLL